MARSVPRPLSVCEEFVDEEDGDHDHAEAEAVAGDDGQGALRIALAVLNVDFRGVAAPPGKPVTGLRVFIHDYGHHLGSNGTDRECGADDEEQEHRHFFPPQADVSAAGALVCQPEIPLRFAHIFENLTHQRFRRRPHHLPAQAQQELQLDWSVLIEVYRLKVQNV